MSKQDPITDNRRPVVVLETEGFFSLSEEEQYEHIRSFLGGSSPKFDLRCEDRATLRRCC